MQRQTYRLHIRHLLERGALNRLARCAPWRPSNTACWLATAVLLTLVVPQAQAQGQGQGQRSRPATATATVQLSPSLASPQPVGTLITWTATITGVATPVYRFGVATVGATGPYTTVRDYSPRNTFRWAPLQEGTYYVRVSVLDGYTGTSPISTSATYVLTSRVTGSTAVVSHTNHPLVALYSAPPCSAGQIMVAFQAAGSTTWSDTNSEPCQAGSSRNFLVAGMLPQTTYQMAHVITNGSSVVTSTALSFTTGKLPSSVTFPAFGVVQPPGPGTDLSENLIFHEQTVAAPNQAAPIATDLQGRVVWYANQRDMGSVTALRIGQPVNQLGSVVYVVGNDGQQVDGDNVLRAIDLAGHPVQETNTEELNVQLQSYGLRPVYGFNPHEVLPLPNGDIAVLAFSEETITTTPIMGDMLLVLGPSLQVVWSWDAFRYLDAHRGPTMGETCGNSDPPRYCPVPGGPSTIDWLHTNAIDYTPTDGNLILCIRNQDWVIKINYANGTGNGNILWRMGPQGDFSIVPLNPSDPYPWFSHQHDANYLDPTTLAVFDDGNLRCATLPPPCHSRGQVYEVNEQAKVVTQTVNVDVGSYSGALGVAQRLSNGNYNFASGYDAVPPPPHGQEVEVLPDGTKEYVQEMNTQEYRAWRLATLYSPINPPCTGCPPSPAHQ